MRMPIVVVLGLVLAISAAAQDLGNQAPPKLVVTYPENVPTPERQGGDTIDTALPIPALPFTDTGTTVGYNNDYEETCPYGTSTGPDVVYRFESTAPQAVDVDLCGSSFDTKVFIYDADLNLIACNDDFYWGEPCGLYVSQIINAALGVGVYFVVVDGWGPETGDYQIVVENYAPCDVPCPAGGVPEGEPSLVNDHEDDYNGGCYSMAGRLQSLEGDEDGTLVFCGVSGWYLHGGIQFRDTDWFAITVGPPGVVEITADAERYTYFQEVGPHDCDVVAAIQSVRAGPCAENTLTITGYTPGERVWLFVAPYGYSPPSNPFEYDYVVWFSGLELGVATQTTTWSTVKALYD